MARNCRGLWILAVACLVLLRSGEAAGCSIPLQPTRTGFVAQVRIGDAGPLRFLFDTGTSVTVFDARLARKLRIAPVTKEKAISTTGTMIVAKAALRDVRAGTLLFDELPVLLVPLPSFPSHGPIDGILGMDVLAGHGFRIDVRRGCVDLDPEPRGERIEAFPIAGRVAIKSESMNFVLDSAASFAAMMSEPARRMVHIDQSIDLTSASGRQTARAGSVPLLRIGNVSLRDVPAAIAPQQDPREDALLPVRLFSSVYVDADRRFVILNGR